MTDDAAGTLRTAAGLMRGRAEASTPGPWEAEPNTAAGRVWVQLGRRTGLGDLEPLFKVLSRGRGRTAEFAQREADAAHIAAMHPAVALAVADWLDWAASNEELLPGRQGYAVVIARAYLGTTP